MKRFSFRFPISVASIIIFLSCFLIVIDFLALPTTIDLLPPPWSVVTIVFTPDNSAQVTSKSLSVARGVLQNRLASISGNQAKVQVVGQSLHVWLASRADVTNTILLGTQIGAIEFVDSDKPIELGAAIPNDAKVILTDADIADAIVIMDDETLEWFVRVTLNTEGAKRLAEYSQSSIGHYLVLTRDNVVMFSPLIQAPMLNGVAEIIGGFEETTAALLAVQMKSGRMPFNLTVTSQKPR